MSVWHWKEETDSIHAFELLRQYTMLHDPDDGLEVFPPETDLVYNKNSAGSHAITEMMNAYMSDLKRWTAVMMANENDACT